MVLRITEDKPQEVVEILNLLKNKYDSQLIQGALEEVGLIPKSDNGLEEVRTLTFTQMIAKYNEHLSSVRFTKETIDAYNSELRSMICFFRSVFQVIGTDGIKAIDMLNPVKIEGFVTLRQSPAGRNRRRSFFRTFIRFSLGRAYVEEIREITKMESLDDAHPKAFTDIQLKEIIDLSRGTRNPLRDHALINLYSGSGVRLTELLDLRLSDVNFDKNTMFVLPKMQKGSRKLRFVNNKSMSIVKQYVLFMYGSTVTTEDNDPYVFSTTQGRLPMSARRVQQLVTHLISKAKSIPPERKGELSVHSFRHSFALSLLEAGVEIAKISRLLGHADLATTMEYLRLFDQQLRDAVDRQISFQYMNVEYLLKGADLN